MSSPNPQETSPTRTEHSEAETAATTTDGKKEKRPIVRSLDNFNLTQKKGTLLNSPRSLLACKQEGIDVPATLYFKDWKDFLHDSKNDKEIAKMKHEHYRRQRDEILEVLKQRRDYIIEVMAQGKDVNLHSPRRLGTSAEPSTERVSTPAVRPSEELTSTRGRDHPPTQSNPKVSSSSNSSPAKGPKDTNYDNDDDDRNYSSSTNGETSSQRNQTNNKYASPEEFLKQEEAAKKAKMLRQVDKMRLVMEKNRQREIQKQEYAEEMQRRYKQQERERQEEREREEIARYLRERAQKKREAEIFVQRDLKEQATLAKQEALQREREAKAEAVMERERERKRLMEIRKLETDLQFAQRRDEVDQRNQQIFDQAQEFLEKRKEKLETRMSVADEARERLAKEMHEELEARKRENEIRTEENRRKREEANRKFEAKLNRYKDRGEKAEEQRRQLREDRERYTILRRLQEQEKDRHRKDILEQVRLEEAAKCKDLAKQLSAEERRAKRMQEAREHEAKLRLAEKELVIQDRVAAVKRLQLRKEHECIEAGERYESKMERIHRMREEMKSLERERLRLQAEAIKETVKPAAAVQMSNTPGPGEYRVIEAEEKLFGHGPGVKMGGLPTRSRTALKPAEVPGPGAYVLDATSMTKRNFGPKLPPQHRSVDELEDIVSMVKSGTTPARSHTSMASYPRASKLPKINSSSNNNRSRSPNDQVSPGGRSNTTKSSAAPASSKRRTSTLPSEVREEDFHTDDDFEDV